MTRRALAYVRISKDRTNETSTETQAARIAAYCEAHGWELVDTIVEAGQSAYKASRTRRPGLRQAMAAVEAGRADVLVAFKIDRVARNTADLLGLVETLEDQGATFVSVTESFDTNSATGRLVMTVLAALAEMESATKSDRTKAWHEHRLASGQAPNGPAPLGYVKPGPNELALDDAVAGLVMKAARRIADGESVRSAARWLTAEGVPITHRGLVVALRNPVLAGRTRDGARGSWPALLDDDLQAKVAEVLASPGRTTNNGRTARVRPLAGIARCDCGGRMRSLVGGKRPPRLLCQGEGCSASVDYGHVETLVEAAVLEHLDPATWASLSRRGSGTDDEAERAKAEMVELESLVSAGKLSPATAAPVLADLRATIAAAAEAAPLGLPKLDDVRAAWPTLPTADRHRVYAAAIESLTIKRVGKSGPRRFTPERVDLRLVD